MNVAIVLRLLGTLLLYFSATMVTMVPFALVAGEYFELLVVVECMAATALLGGGMWFLGRHAPPDIFRREALAVVGAGWLLTAACGALPLYFGGLAQTYSDAFFESMSGLTTTGASILTDIESQSRTMLFWRSFLHFLGGLGIIVFFVAVLPVLGVGGKALYKQEVPGPIPEGLTPRISDTALSLCKIYTVLNIAQAIILMFCGMSFFDAINHAMATMATGGFSTQNASIASYASPAIEWVVIFFMFLAGTNFSLHRRFAQGDWTCYFRDAEFRWYLGIFGFVALVLLAVVLLTPISSSAPGRDIGPRDAVFTALTIQTTTGFGTVDFTAWPPAAQVLLVLLMFVGGMAGSTAGGMKVIRWIILLKSALYQLYSEASPRVIRVVKVGGRPLDRSFQRDTFALFFLWISIFVGVSVIVALLSPEQDIVTSITAVAACLNNIGPGLGLVGPTGNYASQADLVKWILALCMVMGRLELYAILIVMTPNFWLRR